MCSSSASLACSDFTRASLAARSSRAYSSLSDVPICLRSALTASEKWVVADSYSTARRLFSSQSFIVSRCHGQRLTSPPDASRYLSPAELPPTPSHRPTEGIPFGNALTNEYLRSTILCQEKEWPGAAQRLLPTAFLTKPTGPKSPDHEAKKAKYHSEHQNGRACRVASRNFVTGCLTKDVTRSPPVIRRQTHFASGCRPQQ
jgi:hypothetical protein